MTRDAFTVELPVRFRDLDDEAVTVAMRIPELGESSIPMEYEIRVGPSVAATAETVQVAYDRAAGESKPIPEAWRTAIAADMGL